MHCTMPSPSVYPFSVFVLQKQSVLDRFGHSLVGNWDSMKRSAQENAQSGAIFAKETLDAPEARFSKVNNIRIKNVIYIWICVKEKSNILSGYFWSP